MTVRLAKALAGRRGRGPLPAWRGGSRRGVPPSGIGNGLPARTWAVLIDADASVLMLLVDTLREAGSPPMRPMWTGSAAGRPRLSFRVWVGTWAHARAEDVIRAALAGPGAAGE